MDAKIDREDAKKLIQVVLHKGDVSFSNLKDVLDKAGVLKDAEIIEKCCQYIFSRLEFYRSFT